MSTEGGVDAHNIVLASTAVTEEYMVRYKTERKWIIKRRERREDEVLPTPNTSDTNLPITVIYILNTSGNCSIHHD